jgi:RNase P subunit RPR2
VTQSTQDDARRRGPFGVPICPGCRKTMVFTDKENILFADGLADVTYRCETCGTETKRTIKDH